MSLAYISYVRNNIGIKPFLDIEGEGRIKTKSSPKMIISNEWLNKVTQSKLEVKNVLSKTTSTNTNR